MKTRALIFMGRAGSGKDTATEEVLRMHREARPLKFSGPLKDVCALIFGWDRSALDSDLGYKQEIGYYPDGEPNMRDDKGEPMTRRAIMQFIGTDLFRDQVRDDIWLRAASSHIENDEAAKGPADTWVISDARFENEIEHLKGSFDSTFICRLSKTGGEQELGANHQSETEGDSVLPDLEVAIAEGNVDEVKMYGRMAYDFLQRKGEQ